MKPLYTIEDSKADIIVCEITKGIFKLIHSSFEEYKEGTYIDITTLTELLNDKNVVIVDDDSNIVHCNFTQS